MLPSKLNLESFMNKAPEFQYYIMIPSLKTRIVKGNQRFKNTNFSVFSPSTILLGKSNMQHFTLLMYLFMKVDKNYKLL